MDDDQRLLARFSQLTAKLANDYVLEHDSAERCAIVEIGSRLADAADPLPPSFLGSVAAALDDDAVLDRITMLIGILFDDERRPGLRQLLEDVMAHYGDVAAGARVAIARCCEVEGDLVGMRRHLEAAVCLDREHVDANTDLGELAQLRGEAVLARRHLDRAGRPPWGWAALAVSLGGGPVKAGRNEPCPCGSGERFKRCCATTGGWTLEQRIGMLPHRIEEWLDRPCGRHRRLPLACAAAGVADLEEAPTRILDATEAPPLRALHLFEDRELDRLVPILAPMLRDDELRILRTWPSVRHRVWEVGRPDVRRSWRVRDLLTGEEVLAGGLDEVVLESECELLWAALVPDTERGGPTHFAWEGALTLADDEIDDLVHALERGAPARELVELLVTPTLDTFGQLLELERHPSPATVRRAEWLLGAPAAGLDRLDLLDDLVTTTFMRGGGFSTAGDPIRLAARRIVEAEPPQAWEAAQRLAAVGVGRDHVVLEVALAWALAERDAGPDHDDRQRRFLAALDAMPLQRLAS